LESVNRWAILGTDSIAGQPFERNQSLGNPLNGINRWATL